MPKRSEQQTSWESRKHSCRLFKYLAFREISQAASLVTAAQSEKATFDDFVKLGMRYTETTDQFDKIADKFKRFLRVKSGSFIDDTSDDLLRLLAAYGSDPSPQKLAEIGSRLGIENAKELAESPNGIGKLKELIAGKLKSRKLASVANEAFRNIDNEIRNVLKKELKASFVCGAAGAVAGTLSYYALIAETGTITTPSLTVEIDNIFDAISFAVSNNRIDVGAGRG